MAVYYGDIKKQKCDNIKLYHDRYKKAAADIPPLSDELFKNKNEAKSPQRKIFNELIDDFFDGSLDSDKILIGALIYMLIKEGADIKLIIALGYILM